MKCMTPVYLHVRALKCCAHDMYELNPNSCRPVCDRMLASYWPSVGDFAGNTIREFSTTEKQEVRKYFSISQAVITILTE